MPAHNFAVVKTINVADATPLQIDWLVAKCQGYKLVSDGISILIERGKELRILGPNSSSLSFSPSTNPSHSQPIIESKRIGIVPRSSGWEAAIDLDEGDAMVQFAIGPTTLVAGMRCFLISELGETVEVPEVIQ